MKLQKIKTSFMLAAVLGQHFRALQEAVGQFDFEKGLEVLATSAATKQETR